MAALGTDGRLALFREVGGAGKRIVFRYPSLKGTSWALLLSFLVLIPIWAFFKNDTFNHPRLGHGFELFFGLSGAVLFGLVGLLLILGILRRVWTREEFEVEGEPRVIRLNRWTPFARDRREASFKEVRAVLVRMEEQGDTPERKTETREWRVLVPIEGGPPFDLGVSKDRPGANRLASRLADLVGVRVEEENEGAMNPALRGQFLRYRMLNLIAISLLPLGLIAFGIYEFIERPLLASWTTIVIGGIALVVTLIHAIGSYRDWCKWRDRAQ